MMKTLLKAINQAENLYQLYYYKGYINASYHDGVLKEKEDAQESIGQTH